MKKIRNFCIIAHIDHGKSTLADRFLLLTHTIDKREFREQFLDSMDLERERGITIKAHTVRMEYAGYIFNLIDTPGHVDFFYEVSRALAACEGAILLVDAKEGVQAQTLANYEMARKEGLKIIPAINKIDLPGIDLEKVEREIRELLGIEDEEILKISAKTGVGVEELLQKVIERIPAPGGKEKAPLKALVFDSLYNSYRGVRLLIRVVEGTISVGENIRSMGTGRCYKVEEIGVLSPTEKKRESLKAGEVGYLYANIKDIREVRVGDTLTTEKNGADSPLPGYVQYKSRVFLSFYPSSGEEVNRIREALEKLSLNDPSFTFRQEHTSLGTGFLCGFMGSLHAEVIRERLEREFDLDIVSSFPRVSYRIITHKGEIREIQDPKDMPDPSQIMEIQEPWVRVVIFTPLSFMGNILKFLESKRGKYLKVEVWEESKCVIVFELPFSEMMTEFFDRIKSLSSGYATLEYEEPFYRASDLVKVDIYLNKEKVEPLSFIIHRSEAYRKAKTVVERIKNLMPPHQFPIAVRAAIGGKIIARSDIKALRKDVTQHLYGGDVTRKKKLLEKQKRGKKKLKEIGKIRVPQKVFWGIFVGE
ncbi:translation elongation factor 4 [Candidatus Calescamantes bacterium]|nr:translation elongation factor 4 [Candidatus Calescamantes bacterium]